MAIILGFAPLDVSVVLARDGDFVSALVAASPWPAGITIELRLSPTDGPPVVVWPAVIDGDRASWDVPAAQVAMVLDADPPVVVARLHYRAADGDVLVWGRGRVHGV